jgi:formate-dependent nitrite reductase cytochrome c552 subunit
VRVLGLARAKAMEAGEYSYFTGLPCKRGHVAARRTHNSSCLDCHPGKQREQQVVLDRKSNDLARRKAIKAGKNFYFAAPCKYGHIGKRLTSNTSCCECNNKYRKDISRPSPSVTMNGKPEILRRFVSIEKVISDHPRATPSAVLPSQS